MRWTDEQISGIRKLASEGFTRRETADKLGISYDALQGKARRLGIEFDDINDVPHVWIDGKDISSFPDHGLVRLNIEWNADKEHVKPKHYNIEYLNGEDTNQDWYTGIGQTNGINK